MEINGEVGKILLLLFIGIFQNDKRHKRIIWGINDKRIMLDAEKYHKLYRIVTGTHFNPLSV